MAQFIPQSVIDEILSRVDLTALVEQYLPLSKKSGTNYFGLCPFHHEDTPSFSVSPEKQIFYCFGCHKGGNAIRFIQDIEHLSFPEAVRFLAERVQVEIPEDENPEERQREQLKKRLRDLHQEAARFFYHALQTPEAAACRSYILKKRGFSEALVKKFGLGYAPQSWDGLYRHLASKGFKDREIEASGLCRKGKQGRYVDLFRDRLIFPIFDASGVLVAFGGRILGDGQPKYLNSPETPLYHKGSCLYALNFIRHGNLQRLIICEGYLDCMAMHEAGFTETVAGLGTALTERQARLLGRYCQDIIIAYDADAAGQQATLRGLELLEKQGLNVRVLQLHDAKDPDEFLHRFGPDAMAVLLESALSLQDFRFALARREAEEDGHFVARKYQDAVLAFTEKEPNAVLRELYAQRLADDLGISKKSVLEELERRSRGEAAERPEDKRRENRERQEAQQLKEQYNALALRLIVLLFLRPQLVGFLREKGFVEEDLANAYLQEIYRWFVEQNGAVGEAGVAPYLARIEAGVLQGRKDSEILHRTILQALATEQATVYRSLEIEAQQLFKQLHLARLEEAKQALQKMFDLAGTTAERQALLQSIHALSMEMKAFNANC